MIIKNNYLIKRLLIVFLYISCGYIYANPIRIMPLGDSITQGVGSSSNESHQISYRKYLWDRLNNSGYSINFVGSQTQGYAVSPSFDYNHEGYAWWTTQNIANNIYGFLVNNPCDIILLHIGSNDVSPNQSNSSSVAGLNNILNYIDYYERDYNHPIRVVLTTIIQRTTYHQTLRDYNRNLINLANARIANGDKITLIDMEYGAGLTNNDYADGAHPDNSGYYKMSTAWYNALRNILPAPSPTTPNNLTTSSVEHDSVTFGWDDTSNNEYGFKIYSEGALVATLGANVTSYTINNLSPNTNYTYYVVAYNAHGNSSAPNISFKTSPPPMPSYAWLPAVYHIILN